MKNEFGHARIHGIMGVDVDKYQQHGHMNDKKPIFDLGLCVQTYGIQGMIGTYPKIAVELIQILQRHQTGDWGTLDAHDRELNWEQVRVLERGGSGRILSRYILPNMTEEDAIYVVTENTDQGRITTILRSDEY